VPWNERYGIFFFFGLVYTPYRHDAQYYATTSSKGKYLAGLDPRQSDVLGLSYDDFTSQIRPRHQLIHPLHELPAGGLADAFNDHCSMLPPCGQHAYSQRHSRRRETYTGSVSTYGTHERRRAKAMYAARPQWRAIFFFDTYEHARTDSEVGHGHGQVGCRAWAMCKQSRII